MESLANCKRRHLESYGNTILHTTKDKKMYHMITETFRSILLLDHNSVIMGRVVESRVVCCAIIALPFTARSIFPRMIKITISDGVRSIL